MEFDVSHIIKEDNTYDENVQLLIKTLKENEEKIQEIKDKEKTLKEKREIKKGTVSSFISSPLKKPHKINYSSKCIDVTYYKELLELSTSYEDLKEFMPKVDDSDYTDIINTLSLLIQKEFVAYSSYMLVSSNKEDLSMIKECINHLQWQRNLLDEYNDKEKESLFPLVEDVVDLKPILFYTTTSKGNIKLLNDIRKNISREQYGEFLTLFDSIRMATFKNKKKIVSNNHFFGNPFMEVKLNQSRITYEVLTKKHIVVTGAFTKKVQVSKKYSYDMVHNKELFLKNREFLLKNSDNPLFIKEQEKITDEILKILRKE